MDPDAACGATAPLEIACDESGYEGEKLTGGMTDVFAHASVRMDVETAAWCVRETRARIGSPAMEYKANHVLRLKSRPALLWLFGPAGPLHGNAHVYLVDKTYLILAKLAGLLTGDVAGTASLGLRLDPGAAAAATVLVHTGPDAADPAVWTAFLAAANELMRSKERLDTGTPVDVFFRALRDLRAAVGTASGPLGDALALLDRGRQHAESFRRSLATAPDPIPALDPLFPAIARAVAHWGRGVPVHLAHDRQNTLTGERVERLTAIVGAPETAHLGTEPGARLADLRLVDSFSDPRVQIADYVAGVTRHLTSRALAGNAVEDLVALLRPYVDPLSIWRPGRGAALQAAA